MFGFFKKSSDPIDVVEGQPLNRAATGHRHQISAINAEKGHAQKLMELGLPMGSEIRILQHQSGGGAIVAKGNLRIALGPMIAKQVLVSPI